MEQKNVFLDSTVLMNQTQSFAERFNVQHYNIRFEFPEGFAEIPLIEECRALNALDITDPDNFDLMYDITIQMLIGKVVFIYFIEGSKKVELSRFVVTNRYMNLHTVDIIDEYPIVVNWLVEFMAGYLGKKYPRSLKDFQTVMSERKERMNCLKEKQKKEQNFQIKMS